jgi:O-antigen/teichoic acid export membrane protein
VRGVIVPRYLGPGLYGVLGGLGLITKYGAYMQFGLTTALGREVPYALGAGDRERARRFEKAVYSFNLLTSAAAAVGLLSFALVTWGRYRPAVTWGLLVFAALLITTRFDVFYATVFRARRQFGASFVFTGARAALLFVLVVSLLYLRGLYGVFAGLVIGGAVFMVVGSVWTKTASSPWPNWRLVRELAPVGLPLAALGLLGFLLQSVDRLMVVYFMTTRELGLYTLAVTIVTFVYFFPMTVGQAMAPRIYGLPRDRGFAAFENYLVKPSLFITFMVAAVGGLMVLTIIPFIRYVMPAYDPTVPIAAALVVGITCLGGAQGGAHILVAFGRWRALGLAQLGALAVSVTVILAAIKAGLGLPAVAAGSSAGLAVYACTVQYIAWRAMALPPRTVPNAFAYLLVPPALVAGALVAAFYAGTALAAGWAAAVPPLEADVLRWGFRVVIYAVPVSGFGLYVERQTGFFSKLATVARGKLSPAGH